MVVIRLARGGNKHRPYFSIVAADSHARRDGRFIEKIGFYNPVAPEGVEAVRIDKERVSYWTSVGAQLSPAVKKLVKSYN
ncbi:MAG: 30S ribosomal protein S16 [Neisseriaceae bacterium]|jgi:small subunit ribosomal protein S16|nr:MAG: 30S ribosomal protein S16 [Neisseriaceae bacterium]